MERWNDEWDGGTMNGVGVFFSTLAFAWMAYAGYRLWNGTASHTAKWVGVGLVGLLALALAQDLWNVRGGNTEQSAQSDARQTVVVKGDKMCVGCTTINRDGKYTLQSTWIAGDLTFEPVGPQPYALSFEQGSVNLDSKTLSPGCSTGELVDDTKLQIAGAKKFRLEIGPEASCR
jgi:hypothetical protein